MKKRNIFIVCMGILLGYQLLWSAPVYATDYYVDANNGNNAFTGMSPSQAFGDLVHAFRQLRAGDTLYLRDGVYSDTLRLRSEDLYNNGNKHNSGTETQPITVKAYPNETPVIGVDAYIYIHDVSWWVFEGLTFQNTAGIRLGSYDSRIATPGERCVTTSEKIFIRGNRFQHGTKPGIKINCGRNFEIQNNVFDNLRSRVAGEDTNAIVLSYYAANGVISENHFTDIGSDGIHLLDNPDAAYTDIVIANNEFEVQRPYRERDEGGHVVLEAQQLFDNVGENAVDIKQGPGPILVTNNIVHGYRNTTVGQDASGGNGVGITVHHNAENVTIGMNHFYDNQIHINISAGGTQPDTAIVIHNNIFDEVAAPDTAGDDSHKMLFISNSSNVKVLNNTLKSGYGESISLMTIINSSAVEMINNALQNGRIAIDDISRSGMVSDYNAWARVTTQTFEGGVYSDVIGVNDIFPDNLHLDQATKEPLEGSQLIDAGATIGIITTDFKGESIAGQGHDIGAVEHRPSQPTDGPTPDVEAPAVSITAPADGSVVSGIVQVSVTANDNVGVERVKLFADGVLVDADITAPYKFVWDTSSQLDRSTVMLQVVAFDAAGNTAYDATYVAVDNSAYDTESPTVSIISPVYDSVASGVTQVSVAANDNIGVEKVVLLVDGVRVAADTSAPYTFSWDSSNQASGSTVELLARAFDATGNAAYDAINVAVDNSVYDTEPPAVSIMSPVYGSVVSGVTQVFVAATDNDVVDKVVLLIDGVRIDTDKIPPYTFTWDTSNHPRGSSVELLARAFDAAENSSQYSTRINVK